MKGFNKQVLTESRANKGIVGGHFEGVRLPLHMVGRKAGKDFVVPLLCLNKDGSFPVVGSNAGAEKEPRRVANLKAMSEAVIEYGAKELTVRSSVIRERTLERRRLCAELTGYWPDFAEYKKRTDRLFAVIRLAPVQ